MDSADGDNVYEVVVRISDGNESKTKTVTVTVENVEEAGTVSLSQRTPQQGIPVTASLGDKDGSITGTEWQWYKSDVKIGTAFPMQPLLPPSETRCHNSLTLWVPPTSTRETLR